MAGGRLKHWSVHILHILEKIAGVKLLYLLMKSEAFTVFVAFLITFFLFTPQRYSNVWNLE